MIPHVDIKLSDIKQYSENVNLCRTPPDLSPHHDRNKNHYGKKPLILFSGGLDSTYLLHQSIIEHGAVDVIYAMGGQSYKKANAELLQRRRIISYLHRKHNDKVGVLKDYISRSPFRLTEFQSEWRLSQGLPWLLAALQAFDPNRHSRIIIGYLTDDSIMHILPDIRNAWVAICKITNYMNSSYIPELSFPLIDDTAMDKHTILKTMILQSGNVGRNLYKLIWVCELPRATDDEEDIMPCNYCPACQKHLRALHSLKFDASKDDIVKIDEFIEYQKSTSVNNRSLVASSV